MKNARTFVVAALALSGALITGAAQARDHVQWSVNIAAPGVGIGVGNGAVYVAPPLYVAAPVYAAPRYSSYPVVYPAPYPVNYRAGWGDRDHDGIPNRYDRVYNPRWDRDGDGVPNRYDHRDNRRHDRDGDGIPNSRDHHNGRNGYGR